MGFTGKYPPYDYNLDIAKGIIPNHSGVNKFGFNGAVGTSFETVWSEGGLYPWMTAASTLTVESASTNDTSTGTGARTIEVEGLDTNYNVLKETITMNGTTQVTTTGSFLRVYRAKVLTAGSLGKADGKISIKDSGTVVAAIDDSYDNQSLMSVYTVPAGYTAYINKVIFSTGKGKETFCSLNVCGQGAVFNIKHSVQIREGVSTREFSPYLKVDERGDIECRAMNLNAGDVEVSCEFDIILVKN